MNTNKFTQLARLTRPSNALVYNTVRCAGGYGHDDHYHEHHYQESKKLNTKFQEPTVEELAYQLPKKGVFNERVHQWIKARWSPDRDDILNNDKPNKYSAYYWFRNYSL